MKKRLYKKAMKWFFANGLCLLEPRPKIKGKYKVKIWSKWKNDAKKMSLILKQPQL